jgi:hypothetical protein
MCDGKSPAGAGNVPIQLVVIGEESDLPVRGIREGVGVLPGREHHVLIPNVDPLTVSQLLQAELLRLAVAQYFHNREMNDVTVAQPILVPGRKVAVNPMPDVHGCAAHADGLSYQQRGVLLHTDVAVIFQDFFACEW